MSPDTLIHLSDIYELSTTLTRMLFLLHALRDSIDGDRHYDWDKSAHL